MAQELQLSSVIPVYNEEGILREAVTELRDGLLAEGRPFEIILAENGSSDSTAVIAEHLGREFPEVRTIRIDEPNYGLAMRRGILSAEGTFVVCDEIDLCDLDFYQRALDLLDHGDAQMVVGLSLIHISEPTRRRDSSRMPSSA